MTINNLEKFLKIDINRINYSLNYLDKKYINEAARLLPGNNYIAFSVTQGNKYREKSWPLEKFIELAKIIFFGGLEVFIFKISLCLSNQS